MNTPLPTRILVQTLTHPVPSDNLTTTDDAHGDKLIAMLDRICQHHGGCDYEPGVQRWYTHGDEFGYDTRVCYFLVDYGSSDNDGEVPVLCYAWDGFGLAMPELLRVKGVRDELEDEVPFTVTRSASGPWERPPVREIVRIRLRKAQRVSDAEVEYMVQHPKDMEWLERKVRPRFWANFLAQIEARRKDGRGCDRSVG